MVLGQNGRAVRIFNNRIDVNMRSNELNRFGFSVDQISMVGLMQTLASSGASMSD